MVSFSCKCEERSKPANKRNWVITQYKCNHSAFNGWHETPSAYSSVRCNSCGASGRTKAAYLEHIPLA